MTEWDPFDILKLAELLKPPEKNESETGKKLFNRKVMITFILTQKNLHQNLTVSPNKELITLSKLQVLKMLLHRHHWNNLKSNKK